MPPALSLRGVCVVFLLFAACQEKPDVPVARDSPADSPADSADSADSTDSGLLPMPWDAPGFWTDPGPLKNRLAPDRVDPLHWQVRMATSPDGIAWTASPDIIAYGFSSLDLLTTDQGVVLSGVIEFIQDDTVLLEMPSVFALVSQDLQTWGSIRFPIADNTRLWVVDPGLRMSRDGALQAHWYGTDAEGNPAGQPGPHEVYRAVWDGTTFRETALLFSHEWLADPSICDQAAEEDSGESQEWLFFTLEGFVVDHAEQDGPDSFAASDAPPYEFVNVPWCVEEAPDSDPDSAPDAAGVTVYAQNTGGGGPPWRVDVAPDGTSTRETLYTGDLFGYDNCTSPAVTWYRDQYVLFCAVYTTH